MGLLQHAYYLALFDNSFILYKAYFEFVELTLPLHHVVFWLNSFDTHHPMTRLLSFIFLILLPMLAEARQDIISTAGLAEQVSRGEVMDAKVDGKGHVWIATLNGLLRKDDAGIRLIPCLRSRTILFQQYTVLLLTVSPNVCG